MAPYLVDRLDFHFSHTRREHGNGKAKMWRWPGREWEILEFHRVRIVIDGQSKCNGRLLDWSNAESKAAGALQELSREFAGGERKGKIPVIYIAHNIERKHVFSTFVSNADKRDGPGAGEDYTHRDLLEGRQSYFGAAALVPDLKQKMSVEAGSGMTITCRAARLKDQDIRVARRNRLCPLQAYFAQ